MSAAPILTILKDGEAVQSQTIEGEVSVGRGDGNVIRLEDRAISRNHAVIRPAGDGVQIEKRSDFGMLQVNGAECTSAVVKMGDVISMGPYLLRLEKLEQAVPEEPAAVAPGIEITPMVDSALDVNPFEEIPVEPALPAFGDESPTLALSPEPELETAVSESAAPEPETSAAAFPLEDPTTVAQVDPGTPLVTPIQPEEATSPVQAGASSSDPDLNSIFSSLGGDSAFGNGAPMEISLDQTVPSMASESKTRVVSQNVDAKLILISGDASPSELAFSQAEVSIGRGKNCDIVLQDKKSSRKNTIIVRDGNRYILKDLDSANGSYVNGKSVKEVQLSNDDKIRVGDCEFSFRAVNPLFDSESQGTQTGEAFGSLADAEALASSSLGNPFPSMSARSGVTQPLGIPGVAQPAEKKGFFKIYDKYIRNFSTLKPVQKLLVILVLFWLGAEFMDDTGEMPPEQAERTSAKPGATQLTPEQQKYVKAQYQMALDLYTKKEYDKSLYELKGIFQYMPEHPEAKELERYILEAKRILEAKEEERKRKEEEERLKVRIATLKTEIQELMDRGEYVPAREKFAEILEIDPEDAQVGEWRTQIDAFFEEQERIAQEKRVQDEINRAALETFREAEGLQKDRLYHDAIKVYQRVSEMGTSDKSLLSKAKARIQASRDAISELRDPVLRSAKELEKSGDLAGAFREFEKATRIDPPHSEGYAGMDRIRDVLNDQSKALYTEAVIAESYSDFKTAYEKYKEILRVAPTGSVYHERANRKIANYKHFRPEEDGLAP